jgi:lipoyl(octanoyl) transferase
MNAKSLQVRLLGLKHYLPVWQAMRQFSQARSPACNDEIWLLEHRPVFTLGQASKPQHILDDAGFEVVRTDRGGQVTYHGPGQLIVYLLLDLKRLGIGVKQLVCYIQQAIKELLAAYAIQAHFIAAAPGVYVDNAKIASLGLRVRNGYCYHGLALNVDMDLSPFNRINPCGFSGLAMTQMAAFTKAPSIEGVGLELIAYMVKKLGYTNAHVLATQSADSIVGANHA